jgi:hypothetical protein
MKTKIISSIIFFSLLSFLLAFKTGSDSLPIGSSLPKADLKMKDITGTLVSMKEMKKKNGLLVMFSCNTCPYVIRNQQRTKAICKYALTNDIGVILINSNESQRSDADSFEAMKNYAKGQEYQWPYVVDQDNVIADEFGARRTPECFLFNKDLKLTYHGAIDDNPGDDGNVNQSYLKDAMNAILNGKEVAVKESRSVGCSIKRKG